MEEKKINEGVIPFVKPVRVDNFKIWRVKVSHTMTPDDVKDEEKRELLKEGKIKFRKRNVEMEAVCISDLDGGWMVRIPQTLMMYSTLCELYHAMMTDGDEEHRTVVRGQIRTILANLFYVSCVNNGYYHQGIDMLTAAYANPLLLADCKEGREFRKNAAALTDGFRDWWNAYRERARKEEPTQEAEERESTAAGLAKAAEA